MLTSVGLSYMPQVVPKLILAAENGINRCFGTHTSHPQCRSPQYNCRATTILRCLKIIIIESASLVASAATDPMCPAVLLSSTIARYATAS